MYHNFDIDVAKELGVDQAIMIAGLQYWINHNVANKKHFHNGHYWTYNSYKTFTLLFPYWTDKQVRRIVNDLETKGILISGNFNKREYDATKWYAFKDQGRWIHGIPIEEPAKMDNDTHAHPHNTHAQKSNTHAQTGKPIPFSTTIKDTFISSPNGEEPGALFGNDPGKGPRSKKEKICGQKEKEATPHWQPLVDLWHTFYKEKKGMEPTFGGQEGKQLKEILTRLQKRATDQNKPWDEQSAKDTLTRFLQFAYQIQWISDNFLLNNLLKQFDKIIADAIANRTPQQAGNSGNNIKGQQPISLSSVFNKLSQCGN